MLADLRALSLDDPAPSDYRFRLIPRRVQQRYNSSHDHVDGNRGVTANPLYMHPDDAVAADIGEDAFVTVKSEFGEILARASLDASLRRGVVAMTHCYGRLPGDVNAVDAYGANPNLLLSLTRLQPYTGQPVMGNIAVSVERVTAASVDAQ